MTWRVIHADCIEAMRELGEASVDAIVTDPPYGLRFMGKAWDVFDIDQRTTARAAAGNHRTSGNPNTPRSQGAREAGTYDLTPRGQLGFQREMTVFGAEALRVLKPGGHLLSFGGTRTYHRLACALEDAGFEIRDCLAWLYGSGFPKSLDVSKAIDKAAGAAREVTGYRVTGAAMTAQAGNGATDFGSGQNLVADTAPATPDAERWQGWGTALKPAWESIVWATKPLVMSDLAATIGSWLQQAADRLTPTGAGDGSSDPTATSPSESGTPTPSSIVSSWKACWDDLCERTSTFTTGTTSSTTTALRTLSSCLSEITPESITLDPVSGWSSHVRTADALLAALRASTLDTLALSAIVTATAEGHISRLDAGEPEPAFEPIVLARKPLSGTVVQNVLEHGTGALNVDGTRIEADYENEPDRGPGWLGSGKRASSQRDSQVPEHPDGSTVADRVSPLGRWPANVLLDPEAASAMPGGAHRFFATFDPCGDGSTEAGSTPDGASLEAGRLGNGSTTAGSGSRPTARSHQASMFTTETTTDSTTSSTTSSSLSEASTSTTTEPSGPPESSETDSADALDVASGSPSLSTPPDPTDRARRTAEPAGGTTYASGDGSVGSRAFYTAKTSRSERERGVREYGEIDAESKRRFASGGRTQIDGEWVETHSDPVPMRNVHPTVKPVDLMQWLCRLITPPKGLILDPFLGSGSTGIAALREGFDFIGIEREAEYVEIARARIVGDAPLFNVEEVTAETTSS